jgi:hypothetical protein
MQRLLRRGKTGGKNMVCAIRRNGDNKEWLIDGVVIGAVHEDGAWVNPNGCHATYSTPGITDANVLEDFVWDELEEYGYQGDDFIIAL